MIASELDARLEFAVSAAKAAGDLVLRYFRNPELRVEAKADRSPVTEADRMAEALLVDRIRSVYPEDGVLGEELGESPSRSGYRWILDPIDGTRSFARGVPLFGTLVALEANGTSLLGVIHLPACRETVYAARGRGAWWQVESAMPVPARVSAVESIEDATFLCTSPEGLSRHGGTNVFLELQSRCRHTRTWGDCYGYALVATGRADIMIDPGLAIWDAAALLPVLQEAGGAFTDWKNQTRIDGGNGVATNGRLHQAVLRSLS